MNEFQWRLLCDPSDLVCFRQRIGETGRQHILQVTARLHGQAAQTLEKLLRQSPPQADAYALLCQIYEDQNKISEAITVCRRAAENQKLNESDRLQFQDRSRALAEKSGKP
jgi:IS5 family transposase